MSWDYFRKLFEGKEEELGEPEPPLIDHGVNVAKFIYCLKFEFNWLVPPIVEDRRLQVKAQYQTNRHDENLFCTFNDVQRVRFLEGYGFSYYWNMAPLDIMELPFWFPKRLENETAMYRPEDMKYFIMDSEEEDIQFFCKEYFLQEAKVE